MREGEGGGGEKEGDSLDREEKGESEERESASPAYCPHCLSWSGWVLKLQLSGGQCSYNEGPHTHSSHSEPTRRPHIHIAARPPSTVPSNSRDVASQVSVVCIYAALQPGLWRKVGGASGHSHVYQQHSLRTMH